MPVRATRITERDVHLLRSVWLKGWTISSVLMPLLFLAAMGLGLGGVIEDNGRTVGGLSYLHFVAPGMLVASMMQQAAGDTMWPVVGGAKWDRRYFAMIATPLEPTDVQLATLLWVAFRTTLSGAAFLIIASVLGGIASPWGILAIPAGVLCALAFAAVLSAFSITQDTEIALSLMFRLGLMPLFLFSGTFFPISVLPHGLRQVAWISPLWHGVELGRHAATADAHWADLAHIAVLATMITIGWLWGRHTFTRRLTP
jgi:lipooligosaccharide transport system permease protein